MRPGEVGLVCDHCRGLLLSDAELVAAIHELDEQDAPLVAVNQRPAEAACPRCAQPMTTSVLRVGAVELVGRHLRCAHDGVWLPVDVVVGTMARAGHPVPNMKGRTFGGDWADVGMGMKSVGAAFGRTHTPSVIFGGRRAGPRVRAVFASLFGDRTLACAACPGGELELWGDRWRCTRCSSAFIEDAALAAMMFDVTNQLWEPPAPNAETRGQRACPACAEPMFAEHVGGAEIDRCPGHGTFFDEHELEAVLLRAADPAPSSTIAGWLRRIFGRDQRRP
jgi:hypothetical protein